MKNKLIYVPLLLIFLSCASLGTLTRKRAYEINREYMQKKYNIELKNDENTGYILKKGNWIFTNIYNGDYYEIIIDGNGEVIK